MTHTTLQPAGPGAGPEFQSAATMLLWASNAAPAEAVMPSPIEPLADGGALLKPEFMAVGRAYPLTLVGESLVAVKRDGGAIDFYRLG